MFRLKRSWSFLLASFCFFSFFTLSVAFSQEVIVDFIADKTAGEAPLGVTFTDLTTVDGEQGAIDTWKWDFGDGTVVTYNNHDGNFNFPPHTYINPGYYSVTLTVSSFFIDETSKTKENYIYVTEGFTADFSATPLSGYSPLDVQFTDSSTGTPTSWLWNFGDGQTDNVQNPSHTYNEGTIAGSQYTISLTITNDESESSTKTRENYITVFLGTPLVDFTATPTEGNSPLTVHFTDNSTNSPIYWAWNFGDGQTAIGGDKSQVDHTYTSPGTYTVSLVARNNSSQDSGYGVGAGYLEKESYITVTSDFYADFTASPLTGPAPLTVKFTDNSSPEATSWSWNFGDGNISSEQNPTNIYTDAGSYTVTLTVIGPDGTDIKTRANYITVTYPALKADFSGTPTSGTVPLSVSFTDISTGNPTSWSWNFGDGNTSLVQNPTNIYTDAGSYTVTLTVAGPGGTDTETKAAYINTTSLPPKPPRAAFIALPPSGNIPLTVKFTNQSSGKITSYQWSFGDGNSSGEKDPIHTYSAAGTYTVSLTVMGPGGTDTVTKENLILAISPPVVSANNPPNKPDNPMPSDLASNVSINTDLQWTGGDPDKNDTVRYFVYLGTVSQNLISSSQKQLTTVFDPRGLDYNKTYYWQIIAEDNQGVTASSEVWSFTTELRPNDPPVLSEPMANPDSIPNDNDTTSELTVKVTDPEGPGDIDSVTVDLEFRGRLTSGEMEDKGGGIYSIFVKAPTDMEIGNKKFNVTAKDLSGNVATESISLNITDSIITSARPNITKTYDVTNGIDNQDIFIKINVVTNTQSIKTSDEDNGILVNIIKPDGSIYDTLKVLIGEEKTVTIQGAEKGNWTYHVVNTTSSRQNVTIETQGSGTGTLTGLISNNATGKGVSGATVSTETNSVKTLPDGYYFMELAAGSYTLRAESAGYDPNFQSDVTVSSNQTSQAALSINPTNNFKIEGFWTSDEQGNPKSSFAAGDNIKFNIKFTVSTEKPLSVRIKGKASGEKTTIGKWNIRLSRKSGRVTSGSYIWSWEGVIPEGINTEQDGIVDIKASTSKYGSFSQTYSFGLSGN
ncbi:MAG: PKD domain-containing protein [Thermodesulfobacteriota bacterium]|nr:PKD domain-containing protein [Thermodesulfobacteriota bacterium]